MNKNLQVMVLELNLVSLGRAGSDVDLIGLLGDRRIANLWQRIEMREFEVGGWKLCYAKLYLIGIVY